MDLRSERHLDRRSLPPGFGQTGRNAVDLPHRGSWIAKAESRHPRRNHLCFFAQDIEFFEDYIGPEVLEDFDATFDGRKLRVIGYYTHSVPANWKMYVENLKDPYHATLLHSYLVTFGLMVRRQPLENGA